MVKELIRMDWYGMKYYHKRIPLVVAFVFIVGIVWSAPLVIPSSALMALMFSINTFAVEEKGGLCNLYLTLPVKRSSIVAGRFGLAIIMGLCGMTGGIPIMLITNYFGFSHYYYPLKWNIFIFAFAYLVFAFYNLAAFPVLFRLGYEKGKIWGFYLPLLAVGILYGFIQVALSWEGNETLLLNILEFSSKHMAAVSGGLTFLATLVLLVSFALSVHFYKKRDF